MGLATKCEGVLFKVGVASAGTTPVHGKRMHIYHILGTVNILVLTGLPM